MSNESVFVLSEVIFLFICIVYYKRLTSLADKVHVSLHDLLILALSSPVIWQCSISCRMPFVLIGSSVLICELLIIIGLQKNKFCYNIFYLKRMLIIFCLGMTSLSGILIKFILTVPEDSKFNAIFYVSIFVFGYSIIWMIRLLIHINSERSTYDETHADDTDSQKIQFHDSASIVNKCPAEKRDFLLLAGLIAIYSFLVFWKLGCTNIPGSSMVLTANDGNNVILLDFDESTTIHTIYIHSGHTINSVYDISYFDDDKHKWAPIKESNILQGIYSWYEIAVDKTTPSMCINSLSDKAIINEIAILDNNGNLITPTNADDYTELFDEQDLFPEHNTYYYQTMFDEIFYAGSAYEFLIGEPMYESTHPPMGKILISIGELLFGVNPFGWRFICAVFGILMLPVMYWFLYRMFDNCHIALTGAVLFSLDFMHYTLSRIGTIDSVIAFFILCMFALMWRILQLVRREISSGMLRPSKGVIARLLLCAFVTGMGISIKWTGIYSMVGIGIAFFVFCIYNYHPNLSTLSAHICNNDGHAESMDEPCQEVIIRRSYICRLFWGGVILLSLIPAAIYVISFIPGSMASGESNVIGYMWSSSVSMFQFHTNETSSHPYSSTWYSWCLDVKPLLDAFTPLDDNIYSVIATFGNPVIWLSGIIAAFYMLYRSLHKDKHAAYLSFAWLAMYIPWFFIRRTVFIYQYYACSIFLTCLLSYSLYIFGRRHKRLIPAFIAVCLAVFVMFFPVISGSAVSSTYIQHFLQWFPAWELGFSTI